MSLWIRTFVFGIALCPHAIAGDIVDYVSASELRDAVHGAIRESIQRNTDPPFYLVKSVEITLRGIEDRSVGGGFKVPIFAANVSAEVLELWSAAGTKTLKFNPRLPVSTQAPPKVPFADDIALLKEEAILAEAAGWSVDSATITYEWSMKVNADAGIDVFFLKIEGGAAAQSTQKITFNLCRTVNRIECVEGG